MEPRARPALSVCLLLLHLLFWTPACAILTRSEALRELGLSERYSEKQLKSAYRKRSLETHPDKSGGSNRKFLRVSDAYRVLSENRNEESSSGGNNFSSMTDTDRMRMAEEMFFDMFGDIFDQNKVDDFIDKVFEGIDTTFWLRMAKKILKWVVPRIVSFLERDSTIITINGVKMTGREFREMRKTRMNRLKQQKDEF